MATDNPELQGEGSPFMEESTISQQRSLYNSYYTLLQLSYTHDEALKTIGISQQKLDQLLLLFGPKTD